MYNLTCLVVIIANLYSCVYLRDEHRSVVHGLCRNLSEPELGPKGGFGDDTLLFLKTHRSLVHQEEELFGEEKTDVVLSEAKALETSDDLFRKPKANQCIEHERHLQKKWHPNATLRTK